MGGTDHPVFMGGVELGRIPEGEYARPSDERNIMKMDYVESAFIENPFDGACVKDGSAGLLHEKQGHERYRTAQLMNSKILRVLRCGYAPSEKVVGIRIVDDLDVMSTSRQRLGEALYVGRIPSEAVRRIESREHAEA